MVVILLHPVGLDKECWRFAAIEQAVALDLPGHGDCPEILDAPLSLQAIADDVCRRLSGPMDVVGLSMGGMVAMHLALRHPTRVRSLILACTSARPPAEVMLDRARAAEDSGMTGILASTLGRWFSPAALARVHDPCVEYARTRLLADDPRIFASYWRAMAGHDVESQLGNIRVPVTVIAGSVDASASVSSLQGVANKIATSRFEIVPGPHMLPLEEPERFATAVHDHFRWLATLS